MARTPSTMPPLGMPAPSFSLPDVRTGRAVSQGDFEGRPGLLVMFLCNHCPYVKHVRQALAEFGREYGERGLGIVAISSNDPKAYPDDAPEKMKEEAEEAGYPFPYCFDATQEVAKAYGAACTPDFFLFDGTQRLDLSCSLLQRDGHALRAVDRIEKRLEAAFRLGMGYHAVGATMTIESERLEPGSSTDETRFEVSYALSF